MKMNTKQYSDNDENIIIDIDPASEYETHDGDNNDTTN